MPAYQKDFPCIIPGCTKTARARMMCIQHYDQARYKSPLPKQTPKALLKCRFCGYPVVNASKQLCAAHYMRLKRNRPMEPPVKGRIKVKDQQCKEPDCGDRCHARGYCQKHYRHYFINDNLRKYKRKYDQTHVDKVREYKRENDKLRTHRKRSLSA